MDTHLHLNGMIQDRNVTVFMPPTVESAMPRQSLTIASTIISLVGLKYV